MTWTFSLTFLCFSLFHRGHAEVFWSRTFLGVTVFLFFFFLGGVLMVFWVDTGDTVDSDFCILNLLGHVDYWKRSQWWLGVLCDGTAGLMIWPAMPILAAQVGYPSGHAAIPSLVPHCPSFNLREVLMPLATVTQLLVAYCLGLFFFEEKARFDVIEVLLVLPLLLFLFCVCCLLQGL